MGGKCSTYREEERCRQGSSGERRGTEKLERLGHRWENDIKMVPQETFWGCVHWTDLVSDMDSGGFLSTRR